MAEVRYSARIDLPYTLERGRVNGLACPLYRSGHLVAPASGTITIYDPGSAVVVATTAATITGSVATYSMAALGSTYSYGDGWRAEWALTMPDGVVHTEVVQASVVRVVPQPSVTERDLFRRVSALDPQSPSPLTRRTEYSDPLDEAWVAICRRLLQAGNRPWLVLDPSELREPHLLLTLALIFEDLATRVNVSYSESAANYRRQYDGSMARVRLAYDYSQDGTGGAAQAKRAARNPGFFLSSRQ